MIVSASRRTDIPAFYTKWFMNRISDGFLLTRNPFNYNQIKRVSLNVSDVDVIIFWTRNPTPLMKDLDKLDALGYKYYFQFTITGYQKTLEKSTLNFYKAIEIFKKLSLKIGREKVIWRYDPILLSNVTPFEEHIELFNKIASFLNGYTTRVVISFADLYDKVNRNLKKLDSLDYQDIASNQELCIELVKRLYDISQNNNIDIYTCAESFDLSNYGIKKGKCIDDGLIKDIFNVDVSSMKDPGQREHCGCVKSIDIGMYNTCMHGCRYCYATFNENLAHKNYKNHDFNSPFLIGDATNIPAHLLQKNIIQNTLF